ncbi:hypothetical protein BC831DRAFT_455774 [Entophlyctis helioformis]|nr:hypothetical protein BC831DRAFT_455774 [Entophlyctis helioformis]
MATTAPPTTDEAAAIWSTKAQVLDRNWQDWLAAHTTFLFPLHHCEGTFSLTPTELVFTGFHKRDPKDPQPGNDGGEAARVVIRISKADIVDVVHGFDEAFSVWQERTLGLSYKPLIVRFRRPAGSTGSADPTDGEGVDAIYFGLNVDPIKKRWGDNALFKAKLDDWLKA